MLETNTPRALGLPPVLGLRGWGRKGLPFAPPVAVHRLTHSRSLEFRHVPRHDVLFLALWNAKLQTLALLLAIATHQLPLV